MNIAFWISYGAMWLVIASMLVILVGLIRTVYALKNPGAASLLDRGEMAPSFEAPRLGGGMETSASFAGRLTAFLFASPNCTACMTTMEELSALNHKARGNIVVVCQADPEDCELLRERHGLTQTILVDEDRSLGRKFGVSGTPTAVILDERGRILSVGHPGRGDELEQLMQAELSYTPQVEATGA